MVAERERRSARRAGTSGQGRVPTRRALVGRGAALAGAGLLAGCGPWGGAGAEGGSGRTALGGTVTFMFWIASPTAVVEFEQVADSFMQRHERRIKVEIEAVGWSGDSDYQTKLTARYAAAAPPDAVRVNNIAFPQVAERGVLLDLGPLLRRDQREVDPGDFFPSAMEAGQHNGKQYGLPPNFDCVMCFYNEEHLRQLGLEAPDQLYERGRWTLDTVRDYASRITKQDDTGVTRPGFVSFSPYYGLNAILLGFGADFYTKDLKECALSAREALEGLQWFYDRAQRDRVTHYGLPQGKNLLTDIMVPGEFGMALWWVGFDGTLKQRKAGFPWNLAPPPAGPRTGSGPLSRSLVHAQSISTESKNRDAAWAFTKFLVGKEGFGILTQGPGSITPPRQSVAREWEQAAPSGRKRFITTAQRSAPYTRPANLLPVQEALVRGVNAIFSGQQGVREGAEQLVRQVNELIRSGAAG